MLDDFLSLLIIGRTINCQFSLLYQAVSLAVLYQWKNTLQLRAPLYRGRLSLEILSDGYDPAYNFIEMKGVLDLIITDY